MRSLLVRLGLAVLATAVLVGVLRLAGQALHPALPLAVLLVIAACTWLLSPDLEVADALEAPPLDDEPEAVSPHGADVAVRRAEEMMHGAGPRRRMTSRALGQSLALAAAEHDRERDAPPLPADLREFLALASADPDAGRGSVPPVPRSSLQRWLRALAATTSPQEDPR